MPPKNLYFLCLRQPLHFILSCFNYAYVVAACLVSILIIFYFSPLLFKVIYVFQAYQLHLYALIFLTMIYK